MLLARPCVSEIRLPWHVIDLHPFSLPCNSLSLSCLTVFGFSYYESVRSYPKNRLTYPKVFTIEANTLSTSGWTRGLQQRKPPPDAPRTPRFSPTLGVVGLLTANGPAPDRGPAGISLITKETEHLPMVLGLLSCEIPVHVFRPFFSCIQSSMSYRFAEVCCVLWTPIPCGSLTLQIRSPSKGLDFHVLHGILSRKSSF